MFKILLVALIVNTQIVSPKLYSEKSFQTLKECEDSIDEATKSAAGELALKFNSPVKAISICIDDPTEQKA